MVRPYGARLSMTDMGQTSSQVQLPPAEEAEMTSQAKSRDGKRKSKTSKRKSMELNVPIDHDIESARALMQMREAAVQDTASPYYDDNLAASQQLIAESSPVRASKLLNGSELVARSSQKVRISRKNGKGSKKRRIDPFAFTSSEEINDERGRNQHLPSTPPAQVDSSPPPYQPNPYRSIHALDDISTDDEEVTTYMKEYEKENESSQFPEAPEHDIYSLSQQLPDAPDDVEDGREYSTYHLPNRGYDAPKASANSKKRKRRSGPLEDETGKRLQAVANEKGQLAPHPEFHDSNGFPINEGSWTNYFGLLEDTDMPIDPELHSMSALPASVDLSQLDNDGGHVVHKKRKKAITDPSEPPRKRSRMEQVLDTSRHKAPYYSPYNIEHNEENMQDTVLPGLEDSQRQTSTEFGTPFMEDIANRSLEYLDDRASLGQSAQNKKRVSSSKSASRKTKEGQAGKDSKGSQRGPPEKGGPYTATEVAKLDRFRNNYCRANDMSIAQFNDHIQSNLRGNPAAAELFNEACEVLPYRPRISVQKFCRRHFHNFERGAWSAEEDELLRQAVDEKGNNWKAVSQLVGRMADDCRDRYRNYIHNSENRNKEQWTNEEVQSFCRAILECLQAMKDDRRQTRIDKYGEDAADTDTDSDQEEKDIKSVNWQVVSDRMGGTRSRLQCVFKWAHLQTKEKKEFLQKYLEESGFEVRRPRTKNPWRSKRASKKVANMRTGDQYALLQAISDSKASTEGNIPWRSLGDDEFRSTWNSTDKKAAWAKMKLHVPNADSMDYHDVAKNLLSRIEASGGDDLDDKWDPEVHGHVGAKKPRRKKKAQRKETGDPEERARKEREKAKQGQEQGNPKKSEQYVRESDEEGLAEPLNEPQGYNRYDALPRSDDAEMANGANDGDGSTAEDNEEEAADRAAAEEDEESDSLFVGSANAGGEDQPVADRDSAEGEQQEEEEADSLFDGSVNGGNEDQPTADSDVGEELASRVRLLRDA